jgi:predicted nucleotidyltransferase
MSDPHQNPNLAQLLAAAAKLEPLSDQIAFVGGCVTGLLLTDPAAAPVRPTLDVDAIVAIGSSMEFTILENRLRDLGFDHSHSEGAPICRWVTGDLILDLMPTDSSILGFSNRWYGPALEQAQTLKIGKYEIRVITAPYFLATKLEAFHGRGKNDFRTSHDLEDIVTVIDGRPELIDEVLSAPMDLQKYLSDEFGALLSNRNFFDALPGHLLPDTASQQRASLVLDRMSRLVLEG